MPANKQVRRSGAEIIAFHFSSDIGEVRDMVYQPTRYRNPYVYCWGEDYFCCPTERQKLPKHEFEGAWDWQIVGEYYGRKVYRAKAGQEG